MAPGLGKVLSAVMAVRLGSIPTKRIATAAAKAAPLDSTQMLRRQQAAKGALKVNTRWQDIAPAGSATMGGTATAPGTAQVTTGGARTTAATARTEGLLSVSTQAILVTSFPGDISDVSIVISAEADGYQKDQGVYLRSDKTSSRRRSSWVSKNDDFCI